MNHLSFKEIIEKIKNKKDFGIKYLNNLFSFYGPNINNLITDKPLIFIHNFIPLPSRLLVDKRYSGCDIIINNNNEYNYLGYITNNNKTRILFADKSLPFFDNNPFKQDKILPIPFTFPIIKDNETKLILSNIYYFEVTITDKKNINMNWSNEAVSIGYGNKNTPFHSHVGWNNNSFGFHSDDGCFFFNNTKNSNKISEPWTKAGAGIIFIDINKVKIFFTENGKLVYIMKEPVSIFDSYFPQVGYNHSHSIKVNFGQEKFIFDIENLINNNKIISTKNSFLLNNDIGLFLNPFPNKNNKFNKFFEFINNTSIPENTTNSLFGSFNVNNLTSIDDVD